MNRIEVLDIFAANFENLIEKVEQINDDWTKVVDVYPLLSEEELELLEKNGLHFNLPDGIGDAYDLRSQVQELIENGEWVDL